MILSLPGGRSLAALPAFLPRSGWRGSDLDVAPFRSGCELDFCAAMKRACERIAGRKSARGGATAFPSPLWARPSHLARTPSAPEFGQLVCLLLHLPLKRLRDARIFLSRING